MCAQVSGLGPPLHCQVALAILRRRDLCRLAVIASPTRGRGCRQLYSLRAPLRICDRNLYVPEWRMLAFPVGGRNGHFVYVVLVRRPPGFSKSGAVFEFEGMPSAAVEIELGYCRRP